MDYIPIIRDIDFTAFWMNINEMVYYFLFILGFRWTKKS